MAIAVTNPTTGLVEREFTAHDGDEIERRLALATTAAAQLRRETYAQRAEWMRASADLLEAEADDVAVMITREMGKPLAQSRGEALKCVKNMRFYADNAETFLADEPLADPSTVGASAAYARYEPLGVVLAVMPWNYPLWQVIRFAAPALMAGNAGVLKHASNVPESALYLDELFTRGGFPEGAFTTLMIGASAVDAVIDDRRIAAVTLTGSEPAGRSVGARAGAQIKKAVLELGGSDPFIVMPSADLNAAVATAVTARINNNGQSCIAGKRFIVHTDIYDTFAEKFAAAMCALTVGDPMDESVQLGPLATKSGRDEIAELVDDAIERGATVLAGATIPDGDGWFYAPTVLADLPEDARLVMEEAFGPVATLYRAADIDDAIRIANQTTFGLSSAAWTTDPAEQDYLIRELDAGAVFVNGMTISYPELPFGGIKDSGFGRELAAAGIREFCNLKTVWKG